MKICFCVPVKYTWSIVLQSSLLKCARACRHRSYALQCYKFSPPIGRWYHNSITSSEAEALLLSKGQDGSFLVHPSYQSPGHYVLCVRVDEQVSHINIRNKDGVFDVEYGPKFDSLTNLIECYQKRPMVETSGSVIRLKHPCLTTSFFPDNIFQRVSELQKRVQDVYGKTGFWEEFQVCVCVLFGGGVSRGTGTAERIVQGCEPDYNNVQLCWCSDDETTVTCMHPVQ